ncbi:unnamed protein product [Adineta steineri]|uniref:Uncharacterized protein n=1 Tax=Adineta steineri TaxID=433720 RepID=A0A819AZ65_9BILA|nr:unnamed protein product [Adineta steineri]CAF3793318.1 unnamed protein product [Adineta steineri]
MSTHYIGSTNSGNQYSYNSSNATTTQSYQNYNSNATSALGSPGYSSYPINASNSRSSNQQIRLNDSYHSPQSYQSTGGFDRNTTQYYQSPQPSSTPQVRASVRVLGSQDAYQLQSSPHITQASPQQHHFQFDSRQQPGRSTGPAVVYQTPGAAQYTHHNVDLWTEGPSQSTDHYVQAQRVSVRPVATGSPQQSHSISPQRHQDHLQQYYSQLTPEQHQQLLRQQQLQRQQEQNSSFEQQRQVIVQQVSPSSTSYQQQQQHRSTANIIGGQQTQQARSRSEHDRQRQNEQDVFAAQQRQVVIQRTQQQQQEEDDEFSRPVGIRNLMNKFAPPAAIQQRHPRSRSTSSRNYSTSNFSSHPGQTTTSRTFTSHSMTYSALPKSHEPPVNSVEYYQMLQQFGNPLTNIQQAVAPPHIQHQQAGAGLLRDRFTTGSLSEDFSRPQIVNRQPPQKQQQQIQRQTSNEGASTLLSLRDQYMNRAKEASKSDLPAAQPFNISRTIIGEDIPRPKQAPQPPLQLQPAPQVLQKQSDSAPQIPQQQQQQQQQPASTPQTSEQEQPQTQDENVEQQATSFESVPPSTDDAADTEPGTSSF